MSRILLGLFAIISAASALPFFDFGLEGPSFYLYTRQNKLNPELLVTNDTNSVSNSTFDVNRPTKLIVHGWTKSYLEIPNNQLVPAYLARGDYNIFAVDWEEIAALDYISARLRVPDVGVGVAQFLNFLSIEFNLDISKVVIVGHSLGAHVAGFAGKELQKIGGKALTLGYIVGLDAAFPLYNYNDDTNHLTSTDASFVITVHSNGLENGRFEPLGHASFYANNGRQQPGCDLDIDGNCAHARCVYYFMEILENFTYSPYLQCASWDEFLRNQKCSLVPEQNVTLGDPLEINLVPGIYSFTTNSEPLYGHL